LGVTDQFVASFVSVTWHRSKRLEDCIRVGIGFAYHSEEYFIYKKKGSKFLVVFEAYMNFIHKYKSTVLSAPRFYSQLHSEFPKYVSADYVSGRVYNVAGVSPSVPIISASVAPQRNPDVDAAMDTAFTRAMPDTYAEAKSAFGHANDKPNNELPYQDLFRGSNKHQSFNRVPRPVTRADRYKFLKSREFVVGIARVAAGVTLTYDKKYNRISLPLPQLMSDEQINMLPETPLPKGRAGHTCADKRYGNTHGLKSEQSFVVRNTLMAMLKAFREVIQNDTYQCYRAVRPLRHWADLIHNFFVGQTWKYFYALYVTLFRKAETIKISKTPRIIWGVDLLSIMIDYIIKKPAMVPLKCQFERGFTHGVTPKAAGFTYMFQRIVNFYLNQLSSPPHLETRARLCEFFDLPVTATDAELANPLASSLIGKDNDVKAWDFCQYVVNFLCADMVYLYRYGIDPLRVTAVEAVTFMLFCYSSHMRATTMVKIKMTGEDRERCRYVQNLPSGYLGTATDGSHFHSFIQHELQSFRYLMVSGMTRPENSSLVKLCIGLGKLGTPAMHHSDDFIDLVINLAAVTHCLFDDEYHYTCHNLVLKQEENHNKRHLPACLTWEHLRSLINPHHRLILGLDLGTYEGRRYNNGALLSDVFLYDAQERFEISYKPFFTTFEGHRVVVPGVTFLQWLYKLDNPEYFIVQRLRLRLLAKLRNMSSSFLTPSQWVMRLRAYMYLAIGDEEFYNAIAEVEVLYRERVKLTDAEMADEMNREPVRELVTLMSYKLDGLTGEHLAVMPTYADVKFFYTPGIELESGMVKAKMMRGLESDWDVNQHLVRMGEPDSRNPIKYRKALVLQKTLDRLAELRALVRRKA
jgi:hypothetical protein